MVTRDKGFWFGTEEHSQWFPAPLQGADSTPSAWGADGTLLNGGGWAMHSWASHKRYTYEWPSSSSPAVAQKMKSYRDGSYGRGLLYFLDPLIYRTNVLPAHWADPSMGVGGEAPSLVSGIEPTGIVTSGAATMGLPVTSAQFAPLNTNDTSQFVPIPEGYTLYLGAYYSAAELVEGDGIYATPINQNGTEGVPVRLTPQGNDSTTLLTESISGNIRGVRLAVIPYAGSITVAAMIGRLIKTVDAGDPNKVALLQQGPWIGGQGNSGCRFLGTPTYISNSPIQGGRIGFAATFGEVGAWARG